MAGSFHISRRIRPLGLAIVTGEKARDWSIRRLPAVVGVLLPAVVIVFVDISVAGGVEVRQRGAVPAYLPASNDSV